MGTPKDAFESHVHVAYDALNVIAAMRPGRGKNGPYVRKKEENDHHYGHDPAR